MITRSICIVLVALVCVVSLSGCGVPKGYKEGEGHDDRPIVVKECATYDRYTLYNQFESLNDGSEVGKIYFLYENEKHYVVSMSSRITPSTLFMSVVKESNGATIGELVYVQRTKKKSETSTHGFVFFDGGYIYYGLFKSLTKGGGWSSERFYYKYEHYRFNLRTGKNESVKLAAFFEKLSAIDDRFELNQ